MHPRRYGIEILNVVILDQPQQHTSATRGVPPHDWPPLRINNWPEVGSKFLTSLSTHTQLAQM